MDISGKKQEHIISPLVQNPNKPVMSEFCVL